VTSFDRAVMHCEVFRCGPLEVTVGAQTPRLHGKIAEILTLYTAGWTPPFVPVHIRISESDAPAAMIDGSYLICARMRVDATADGLHATGESGAACRFVSQTRQWSITVPRGAVQERVPEDVEDLVGLVLATAWREAGWVPLHAGAVGTDGCCALLTAPSGGGKTTLTAALIRRGWLTLGDDKLLLRTDPTGRPQLRALLHNFNLHPDTRRWFPEVGDLRALPRYSEWTEKRRVRIGDIWPNRILNSQEPTHLVQIERRADGDGVTVSALDHGAILSTLLRQTVVPREPAMARHILATVAATAKRLVGWRVDIGGNAYHDPECLAALEAVLR